MQKLTQEEIESELQKMTGWSLDERNRETPSITKTFTFKNFKEALIFVNKVGDTAEALEHHPDIDIRYSKVTTTLSTHDVGGLSSLDFKSAEKYDSLM